MASRLAAFESELRKNAYAENIRPFVCEGSPLECQIFIVGHNPATANVSFWDYWTPEYGFEKSKWLPDYEQQREQQGKRKRSETRKRIEWIIEAAGSVKCLETNIYATPSPSKKQLRTADRDTRVFRFLLDSICPRVILAHGKDARQYIERLAGIDEIRPWKAIPASLPSGTTIVYAGPHFTKGWSKETTREVARELKAICDNAR